jgi:hypothetical protein
MKENLEEHQCGWSNTGMVDKKGDGGLHKSDVHYRLKLSFYKTIHAGRFFFAFWLLLRKILTSASLWKDFKK